MSPRATRVEDLRRALAGFLISVDSGDRLPTVRQLARVHGGSLGSVQAVLLRFEEEGAVTIERRGHLGSFLRARDVGRLWTIIEGTPLIVALPLSHTPRFEGLATGLKQQLTRAGFEAFLIFMAGSRQRVRALRHGSCRIAVMSAWAADMLCTIDELPLLTLPPSTYIEEHRVYQRQLREDDEGPLRVVVDQHSADQQLLSQLEFVDEDVTFTAAPYMQFGRLLENGHADALLWSTDEMPERLLPLLTSRALSPHVRDSIGERDTQATLVGLRTNGRYDDAVVQALDVDELVRAQEEVIAGTLVPEY